MCVGSSRKIIDLASDIWCLFNVDLHYLSRHDFEAGGYEAGRQVLMAMVL